MALMNGVHLWVFCLSDLVDCRFLKYSGIGCTWALLKNLLHPCSSNPRIMLIADPLNIWESDGHGCRQKIDRAHVEYSENLQ